MRVAFLLLLLGQFAWAQAPGTNSSVRYPAHEAAASGNLAVVRSYIERGGSVDAEGLYGNPLLMHATLGKHLNVARYLFDQGAKTDIRNRNRGQEYHFIYYLVRNGWVDLLKAVQARDDFDLRRVRVLPKAQANQEYDHHLLVMAVTWGKKAMAMALIDEKLSPRVKTPGGDSLLHRIAHTRDLDLVKALVARGAPVRAKNNAGAEPMHRAASSGNLEMVRFFLSKGVSAKVKDKFGGQPIHAAASRGSLELVRFLLSKGASAKVKTVDGTTPLHMVAKSGSSGSVPVIQLLITKGASPNAKDKHGKTPLHWAASHNGGNLSIVKALVEGGASIRALTKTRDTPMHLAANVEVRRRRGNSWYYYKAYEKKKREVITYLAGKGAGMGVANSNQQTPPMLHLKRLGGAVTEDYVDFWFGLGASLHIIDEHGRNFLGQLIVRRARFDLFHRMAQKGFSVRAEDNNKNTLVHLVMQHYPPDMLRYLKYLLEECRLNVNAANLSRTLPVHYAYRNLDVLKYLIERRAKWKTPNPVDRSHLLHKAATARAYPVVKYLLDHGAKPNVLNGSKQTPLYLLSRLYGSYRLGSYGLKTVELLLEKGARPKPPGLRLVDDNTILHNFARFRPSSNLTTAAELLIEAGAKVRLVNKQGEAPIHIAIRKGNDSLFSLFLRHGGMRPGLLFPAVEGRRVEIVRALLAQGARPNLKNKAGETPLLLALKAKQEDLSRLLIDAMEKGFNDQFSGETLVHVLSAQEPSSVGTALSEVERNRLGETVGTGAADLDSRNFQSEMVQLLHAKGANLDRPNKDGSYPIHLVARSRNMAMLVFFVRNEVRLSRSDRQGKDALYYAVEAARAFTVNLRRQLKNQGRPARYVEEEVERRLDFYASFIIAMAETKAFKRTSVSDAIIVARQSKMNAIAEGLKKFQ